MSKQAVTRDPRDVRSYPERLERAKEGFFRRGESLKSWAEKRGYSPKTVYNVLNGHHRCARGQLHLIAVDLGLKGDVHTANGADSAAPQQFLNKSGE